MTLDELQKLMLERKIVPFVDGMYLALSNQQSLTSIALTATALAMTAAGTGALA